MKNECQFFPKRLPHTVKSTWLLSVIWMSYSSYMANLMSFLSIIIEAVKSGLAEGIVSNVDELSQIHSEAK